MRSGLPIDEALPRLRAALMDGRNAVLVAPPGAGKSTVVPLALLGEPWARGQKIVLLEPRRLAARAVAARMASSLGERPGDTVGYRMRLDTRVSGKTRIEVVTEGVFTRMLQSDPALGGVAAVIFDEFHERSLNADVGLAFALDAQRHVAPALRVLAMSATLDGAAVARLLGGAPVIEHAARVHAVEMQYVGKGLPALPGPRAPGEEPPDAVVARVVRRALAEASGDLLVFLAGAGEIRRVQTRLGEANLSADVDIRPLYGELPAAEQDAALDAARAGRRKIVLATNIAETSLTIDGVRAVVDSGLERRSVFDPGTGMSRLETQRISRASADQRAGRAGRTAPGVCYRIWAESAQRALAAQAPPEMATADLAPLALELAAWGTDAGALDWLDAPPAATLAAARDLLRRLEALDDAGRVTAHGRALHALGLHPRLAQMLLAARELGVPRLGSELAALLSERDVLRGGRAASGERDSDIRSRLDVLRRGARDAALERVRRLERTFRNDLGVRGGASDSPDTNGARDADVEPGVLLAFAYPDRIAKRRAGDAGRYQLANGRGASFANPESIAREEFVVAVDVDDRDRDARILLAAPLAREDLLEHFAAQLVEREEVVWDARAEAVTARRTLRLGELVIEDKPLENVPVEAAAAALVEGLRALGPDALPWDDDSRDLVARSEFVRGLKSAQHDDDGDRSADRARAAADAWPDFSTDALMRDLAWLEPFLAGATRRTHLARVPLAAALRARLMPQQQRALDELAPTHVTLPTGTRAKIDYRDDNAPAASMRMQEVFGLAATPKIGGGRVAVTFKLLSPAHRPLQVTRDLASFWRNAYVDVRKDMRGRYPRHYWPENPLEAEPTKRAKPRPKPR
jgi:ATP-dependent helicase HrpB